MTGMVITSLLGMTSLPGGSGNPRYYDPRVDLQRSTYLYLLATVLTYNHTLAATAIQSAFALPGISYVLRNILSPVSIFYWCFE